MANFLTYPVFTDIILPFLLIFTVIFAILEKSKLLGEGKSQVNAIMGFVAAAIVIAFSNAVNIINQMTVFMVIVLMTLFVFMIIYGFAHGPSEKGDILGKGVKTVIGVIAFVGVVAAVLIFSGYWDKVYDFFTSSEIGANIVFLLLVVAAIVAVVYKKGESK